MCPSLKQVSLAPSLGIKLSDNMLLSFLSFLENNTNTTLQKVSVEGFPNKNHGELLKNSYQTIHKLIYTFDNRNKITFTQQKSEMDIHDAIAKYENQFKKHGWLLYTKEIREGLALEFQSLKSDEVRSVLLQMFQEQQYAVANSKKDDMPESKTEEESKNKINEEDKKEYELNKQSEQEKGVDRNMLVYCFEQQNFIAAEIVAKILLDNVKDKFGANTETFWNSSMEYIEVHKKLKNDRVALQLYLQLEPLTLQLFGDKHEQSATLFNNIAMCYYHTFQHAKTIPYFQKTLTIFEKIYPANDERVIVTRNNISSNRMMARMDIETVGSKKIIKGDFTRGFDGREPQAEDEKVEQHADSKQKSNVYQLIASMCFYKNDLESGIVYLEKALSITPNDDFLLNNLGYYYYVSKQYKLSYQNLLKSLEINSDTDLTNGTLGNCLYEMKRYDEAAVYLKISLSRKADIEHPDVGPKCMENYANILYDKGNYQECVDLCNKLIVRDNFGKNANRDKVYFLMCKSLDHLKQFKDALEYARSAVAVNPCEQYHCMLQDLIRKANK
eukprot:301741_1